MDNRYYASRMVKHDNIACMLIMVCMHHPNRSGHKSQGATLSNKTIVWMEEAFCPGLLYVSSRAPLATGTMAYQHADTYRYRCPC